MVFARPQRSIRVPLGSRSTGTAGHRRRSSVLLLDSTLALRELGPLTVRIRSDAGSSGSGGLIGGASSGGDTAPVRAVAL